MTGEPSGSLPRGASWSDSVAIRREQVLQALATVTLGEGGTSLASSGRLSEILIDPTGRVMFSIAIEPSEAAAVEPARLAAEAAVRKLSGVSGVFASLTADRPAAKGPATSPSPAPGRPAHAPSPRAQIIPGVTHVIAVASGKGGVGKSTTACNLALALLAQGLKIGVLDADIYGPSMPKLFGLHGKPRVVSGRILEPLDGYGVKVMSIGFMVEEETPMIWRGPMVMSAITQMLREVAWGDLDVLVVDMPPGTGDAQLTMAQQAPLSGAVIVSTPQDIALIDARRAIAMFQKVNIPLLGLIENMSSFCCPACNQVTPIFGHGGARQEAELRGIPWLGEVPLDIHIRQTSDDGRPIVAVEPESVRAMHYIGIAREVWAAVAAGTASRPAPRIVIE